MTDLFKRGTAPGRARSADKRTGSFKPGHKKLGGRKRGTPNVFSLDYKKAILEAAYRIGEDGNGKNGLRGYLAWVALRHPRIYSDVLLTNLLTNPGWGEPEEPRPTTEENSTSIRNFLGLTTKNPTKGRPVEVEPGSPLAWTGQPFPVDCLMHLAIVEPKGFCQLLIAAFAPRPAKRRRPAAPREFWPQDGSSQDNPAHRVRPTLIPAADGENVEQNRLSNYE